MMKQTEEYRTNTHAIGNGNLRAMDAIVAAVGDGLTVSWRDVDVADVFGHD